MVETEQQVEDILREIRERVRIENGSEIARVAVFDDAANIADAHATAPRETNAATGDGLRESNDALLRMKMNLMTTDRAWSNLPPLSSRRFGSLARIELWVKRQLKRATRWYVWEQINFNSAVHQSLNEINSALAAHNQTLLALHQQNDALHATTVRLAALQNETQNLRAQVETRFVEIENSLAADLAQLRQTLVSNIERLREDARQTVKANNSQNAALQKSLQTDLRAMLADALRQWEERLQTVQAHTEGLQDELRERIRHTLDEQRACYKQLALQTSESAVVADRARRNFEQRLIELESSFKFQVSSSK